MLEKKEIYSRICLVGESDTGKSFSTDIIAMALAAAKDIRLYDLENRGQLYRSKHPIGHRENINPPHEIGKVVEIIEKCKKDGTKVLILDGCSNIWDWMTSAVEVEGARTNTKDNRRVWKVYGNPLWDKFLHAINYAPFHVITTWRVKDDPYSDPAAKKKKVIARHGIKGLKFDYHLVFAMDESRCARVVKDNYDLFPDWKEPRLIDAEVGKKIAKWLKEN